MKLDLTKKQRGVLEAEIASMREAQGTQRTAMVRAAAELRHTYGNHAQEHKLDPELVSRAIRLLEEATHG